MAIDPARAEDSPVARVSARLREPVSSASLAVYRGLFGLLLAGMMTRLLALGWVDTLYLEPEFHFTYPGFGWVRPLPAGWMHALVAGLAVCGVGIAAGFFYRFCAGAFLAGFVYLELIERALYLNHYYLVSLLCLLNFWLPLHARASWDVWAGRARRRDWLPAWMVWLLRFQLAVVYVFAGLAKLNADWLFEARPLRMWLAARSDLPWLGPWLELPWMPYAFSWAGAAYDLLIVPALLHRRTRVWAFATVVIFHTMTWVLFPIGMFPWVMMIATALFFPPDWPLRWSKETAGQATVLASEPPPAFGRRVLLAGYCAVQIVLPLRPYLPGVNSAWTGRGFDFSWRVMLVEKSGHVEFHTVDEGTGSRRRVPHRHLLRDWQERQMAQQPELIRQFARHLARKLADRNGAPAAVYADSYLSLNGRPAERLIRPGINLAAAPPPDWVTPGPGHDGRPRAAFYPTSGM